MIQQNKAIKLLIIVVIILSFAPIVASAAPFAYITNYGSNNVSVIDTSTNTVTANVTVGTEPYGVAVNPAGTRVYVSNYLSNNVSVINTSTNTVTANVTVGTKPIGVAVNPAGTRVYVANRDSNNVSVINTSTNTVTTNVTVGSYPYGVAVNPAGTRVYVANLISNSVSVINTSTNTVTDTVTVGTFPIGVAVNPAGTRVYVANLASNDVSVINTSTNMVADTVTVGSKPYGVAVNPAGTHVYVSNYNSSNVSVINTSTNTVTANVTVGSKPFGVAVNPAGTHVYVSNEGSNSVSVINTSTNTVTDTVTVGTRPYAFGIFITPEGASDTTPPVPTDLQNTTGTDWVNFTWTVGDGIVTDGYNVSMNGEWDNTTNTFLNSSVGAGNWSNITVWSWNATGDGNMSVTNVSDNVQAPAAPTGTTPPVPTDLQNTTGTDWVNFTWTVGDGIVTDGYNVSMNGEWDNTTNTFLNSSVGAGNWSNITVWSWNATGDGNMSVTNVSDNVQAPAAPTGTTPPVPTDLQNTTGTDWVNFTWTVGDGIVTDGYNVSTDVGWANTTNTSYNYTDLGPSGWANITVWAWNATGDGNMSATNVSDTVQAPTAILQRINITETSQTLNISESMTFNATGYDYTNAIYPSNITFTWYTTPSGIGTLNATTGSVVNFTALHAGRTEIYAVNGSISSNATDSVWITVNAITNTTEVSGGNATATSGDSTAIVNLTNSTVTGTINFTEMGDPVNSSVVNGSTTGLGTNVKLIKGVDVNVSKNITKALAIDTSGNSYVYIRIDYNQSQIDGLGIDEDTLHIYKFVNGTGWMELVQGNPTYCIANGRNTTADYIWVNVTNCSTFLLAGTPTAEPTPPRSSSGGGGGGVGTSDEPENVEETVFLRIYLRAGDSSTYNFNNLVTSVEVTPTRTYGLLGAKMEVLYGQPGSITTDPPSGESYKYFNVFFARTSGSGDKFSSSVINFQVPESWFKENNIDPATVTLYRYNDDGWKPLTTTMTGQAGGNYQYSAPTPGFSTFVIMGQVNESSSVEPVATEDSGTVADSTPTEEATTKGTPGFGILVGIMGILVAVYSRKK